MVPFAISALQPSTPTQRPALRGVVAGVVLKTGDVGREIGILKLRDALDERVCRLDQLARLVFIDVRVRNLSMSISP